jgi:hypothetical protein
VDINFDDFESEGMRNKARFLREMFPELPIIFIYYTLMTFRADLGNAVACLTDKPPIKFLANLTKLREYFPESKMEQSRDVLVAEMGDFEAAKKRLQSELPLDEVTAQISIQLQDDQPSKDGTKASSSPRTLTSTTKTSHINGVIKSFKISTKTQTTSVVKSKPSAKPATINLTEEDYNSSVYSSMEPSTSPAPFIKNEDDSGGSRRQNSVKFDASAVNLQKLFLGKSLTDCASALDTCHGDESAAYDLLDKGYIANINSLNKTSAARKEESNGLSSQGIPLFTDPLTKRRFEL